MKLEELEVEFEDENGKQYSPEDFIDWYEDLLELATQGGFEEVCIHYKPDYVAARVYLIAKEQGLNAAMMWKLANG